MPSFIEQIKDHAFRQAALCRRGFPYALSEQEVIEAEDRLGFRLPAPLRHLYLEVADGGFGPGQNPPYPGGIHCLSQSVEFYLKERNHGPREKDWEADEVAWPGGLLPLCDWGCGRFSSIDCTKAPFPIVYHHAELRENEGGIGTCSSFDEMRSRLDEYGFFTEFGRLYGNSWVVARSLQSWLTAWLTDLEVEIIGYPKTMRREKDRQLPYME